jgi:hypothetical protein
MKTKAFKIAAAMILLCSLQATVGLPQPPDVSPANPLLLNGRVVTIEQFAYVNRGIVSLAKGDAPSGTAIPFYIYLRRGGKILNAEAYAHNHAVLRYEIADILKSAKTGDELIIDPSEPANKTCRKIITIKYTQILPQFDWSYGLIKKKDNC